MPGEAIASCAPGTDAIVTDGKSIAAGNGAAGNGAAAKCAAACCCISACLPSLYAAPVPLILASLVKYIENH